MIDITETHAFFYTEWPSNFYRAPFMMDGKTFFCTEQAFMYLKAMHFNDTATAEKILRASTPMEAKELGRQVSEYDDLEWARVRYDAMLRVNREKYLQNTDLRARIIDKKYRGVTFVEASPVDRIWGIGMSMDEDGVDDESNWDGENLLGKVITQVRDELVSHGARAYA